MMAEDDKDSGQRRRGRIGLLELSILAAVVTVAGAIITLAIIGASNG